MTRLLLLVLALAGCGGCGSELDPTRTADTGAGPAIDPRLEPYVEDFVAELEARGLEVRRPRWARLVPLSEPYVGECYLAMRAVWVHERLVANHDALRAVLYHELAHCGLGLSWHDPRPNHLLSASVPQDLARWDEQRWTAELDRLAKLALGGAP